MANVEVKLNNLLGLQPITPLLPVDGTSKGEIKNNRKSYSKTTKVSAPVIKKITINETPTAINGLVAADKGIPNTLMGKYVKIGNSLVPTEFFKPRAPISVLQPGVAAAAKINQMREVITEEGTKDIEFKFEQYLSDEKKDQIAFIYKNFNNYLRARNIEEINYNKDAKMMALFNLLNNTQGDINIFEPLFIDSALLLSFSDYNKKKIRNITYIQPEEVTFDYVKNNSLLAGLPVTYTDDFYNYNELANFSYLDIYRARDPYEKLFRLFRELTIGGKHSPKIALIASPVSLGDSEEEFYKLMGFDIFNKLYTRTIGRNLRFRSIDEIRAFYTSIFSLTPEIDLHVTNLNINQEKVENLLNEVNKRLEAAYKQKEHHTRDLYKVLATMRGLEQRGEVITEEMVMELVLQQEKAIQEKDDVIDKLSAENNFLKTMTMREVDNRGNISANTSEVDQLNDIANNVGAPPLTDRSDLDESENKAPPTPKTNEDDEDIEPPDTEAPNPFTEVQPNLGTMTPEQAIANAAAANVNAQPLVPTLPPGVPIPGMLTSPLPGARSPTRRTTTSLSPPNTSNRFGSPPRQGTPTTPSKFLITREQLSSSSPVPSLVHRARSQIDQNIQTEDVATPRRALSSIAEAHEGSSEVPGVKYQLVQATPVVGIRGPIFRAYEDVIQVGKSAEQRNAIIEVYNAYAGSDDVTFMRELYQACTEQQKTYGTDRGKMFIRLGELKTAIAKVYQTMKSRELGRQVRPTEVEPLLLGTAPTKLTSPPPSSSSSSSVSGSGLIKGGSLPATHLNVLHSIVFIKKIINLGNNIFVFNF